VKIYNNNPDYGDEGPFEFDGDNFETACEAFADEMKGKLHNEAVEDWAMMIEMDEDADDCLTQDEWLAERVAELREEFIEGLVREGEQETYTSTVDKIIREERDKARREICETRSNVSTPAQYAAERGWSYLYETKESE
jgi:hypothetical protein